MNTAYAFAPHLPVLMADRHKAGDSLALFALVDLGQRKLTAKEARLLERLASRRLYAGHPEEVVALSPVLLALPQEHETLAEQIVLLDRLFAHRPITSLIQSRSDIDALTAHLLSLSFIEADGTGYLLRLADAQMLKATLHALHPEQRTLFFSGISAWWRVDHHGQMENLASGVKTDCQLTPPLKLDARQTSALLEAAELPLLAAQLSHLDSSFDSDLSHAQRMVWLEAALREVGSQGAMDDAARLSWLAQAWAQEKIKSLSHS